MTKANRRAYTKREVGVQRATKDLAPERSLAARFPKLLEEWDWERNSITPSEVSYGIDFFKVWWKCQRGHSWAATILSRTNSKSGCPACKGRVAIAGESDVATFWPVIVSKWSPKSTKSPHEVSSKSHSKVWRSCVRKITNTLNIRYP